MSSLNDTSFLCLSEDIINSVKSTIQDSPHDFSSSTQETKTNMQTRGSHVNGPDAYTLRDTGLNKRKRNDGEVGYLAPRKRQFPPKGKSPHFDKSRTLACPFFKKDPRRHWDCANFKAKDSKISHVKQHIYRKHTRPHFCAICGTEFEDPRLCDEHMRAGCLSPRAFLAPDGITIQQRNELSHRSISKLDVESQWNVMFDIVCPGSVRPSSPYNNPEVFEDFGTENFITSDVGINAMLVELLQEQTRTQILEDEIRLREAVLRGLQSIVKSLRSLRSRNIPIQHADQGTAPDITQATPTPVTNPSIRGDAPTAENTDFTESRENSAEVHLHGPQKQSELAPMVPSTQTINIGNSSMYVHGNKTKLDEACFRPQEDFRFPYPTTGVDLTAALMSWSHVGSENAQQVQQHDDFPGVDWDPRNGHW